MKKAETVDDYISKFPSDIQVHLQKMRRTIKEAAPLSEEVISYKIPTYKQNGALVHFAAFKDHISFFPTADGKEKFKEELSKYKGGKGTVQFPLDKPIPYGLVRKIVLYRVHKKGQK